MTEKLPVLYSFRRCPYAMRARLAIAASGIQCALREVVLKDKPAALLAASPKATVPVLITAENTVIDESLDIMLWALEQSDPHQYWQTLTQIQRECALQLIKSNDGEFKYYLDRYKYADRYPEQTQLEYRQAAEKFLQILEQQLEQNNYLLGATISVADLAIWPFIRQFAFVDMDAFNTLPYPKLIAWLQHFLTADLFHAVMHKYQQWLEGDTEVLFP